MSLEDYQRDQLTTIAMSAIFDAKNDKKSIGEMRGIVVEAVVAAAKPMMRDELVEELAQAGKKPISQRDRKAIRDELMDELIERSRHLGFVAGDYFGDGATLLQHDRSDSTWASVTDYLKSEKDRV